MTIILEPGFETTNGWTYSELQGEGWTYSGSQSATWKTEGSYSYLFKSIGISGSPPPRMVDGDCMRLSRVVNFDSDFVLRYDCYVNTGSSLPGWQLRIKVDNTIIETIDLYDGEYLNHDTPKISGYIGNHTLTIELYYPLAYGWHLYDWSWYIDNLRVIESSHLECVSNICTRVTGAGTNTCSTEGSTTECLQSTHYIEYDLSAFPTDFLNLISGNIVYISNNIGGYIPLGTNILYEETVYDNGQKKLKMYFKYTPTLSLYNLLNNKIETLVTLTDMVTVAAYVTGIIILVITIILGVFSSWIWIPILGIALGIALLYYKLVEIQNNGITNGSGPTTPEQQIKTVQDFVDNYLTPDCDASYPTCAANPPTCDANIMRAYLSCVNNARLAQCQHAKAIAGLPVTNCDTINIERANEDTCLANGTCTPSDAKNRSTTYIVNPVKEIVTNTIQIVTCPSGYAYNKDTQKCVKICNFPFIGQCLDTPIYIGSALIIGYVAYKLISSNKKQHSNKENK